MDENTLANFVTWDQDCNNIIEILAPDLRKKMIEVLLHRFWYYDF